MTFAWMRAYHYSLLQANEVAASRKTPSTIATLFSSRRIRTLLLLACIALLFLAISPFTDVSSHLQDFSPKQVYDNFKSNALSSNAAPSQSQTNPTKQNTIPGIKTPEVHDNPNKGSGQPKETGNEPIMSDGKKPPVNISKSKPHMNQPSETGNEPVVDSHSGSDHGILPSQPQTSDVDWSSFAYVQYVTNGNYLCNSLMILEALHRLGAKADRIMMYPEQWKTPTYKGASSDEERFLLKARDQYGVKLVPIKVVSFDRGDDTWKDSYTKLLAFNQTQYKRVISLDSDAIVQQSMDELFLLPHAPVAMPRAYWLDQPFLSSQLLIVTPSTVEWTRISTFMNTHDDAGFDMDILNKLYKDSATIIPHRAYDLLTAEFRHAPDKHASYLGSAEEKWDGRKALDEAKFVHFSDWPVKKPWAKDSIGLDEKKPDCVKKGEREDCTDREIWLGLYSGYATKRKEICGREYDMWRRSTNLKRRKESIPAWFEYIVS